MIGLPQHLAIASSLNLFRQLRRLAIYLSLAALLIFSSTASAGVGGSISGTITDSTGAVIAKATVTATNTETGIQQTTVTDNRGFYSFPASPSAATIFPSSSLPSAPTAAPASSSTPTAPLPSTHLAVGASSDVVTVIEDQLHVETTSTQMGEVITGAQMTAVPLNGRSFTDLLSFSPASPR